VAANLLAGRASLLLEPGDEGVDSELLVGNAVAASLSRGRSRSRRGSGSRNGSGGGRAGGSGSRGGRSRRRRLGLGSVVRAGAGAGTVEQSRSRDLVLGVVTVDADLDTRVGGSVELVSRSTLGGSGTGSGNLDVDALGVVLSTVLLAGRVESDDLVTENVLARGDALGDRHGPGVVVGDELVRSPLAVLEASSVNLEELKVARLGSGGIVNLGKVVDDGTDVGLGPGGPRDVELATSGNSSNLCASSGVLVASNLGGIVVHGRVDEAVVEALGARPFNDLRRGGLVLERRVIGSKVFAVNLDGRKMAVGADGGSKGAKDGSGLDGGRHCSVGGWKVWIGRKGWCSKRYFEINEDGKECEALQALENERR
jgi:hypothetical protein